jgi:hypothetical protein
MTSRSHTSTRHNPVTPGRTVGHRRMLDACSGFGRLMGMRQPPIFSIVYMSTATDLFSDDDLSAVLMSSRSNNVLTHLTGMLLYREGRFLQVLEGPEVFVRGRMSTITADPRHTGVRVLLEERIEQRRFPHWTMGYEPLSPTMSNEIPGFRKMFVNVEQDEDRADTIRALKTLIQWFQERAQGPDWAL